MISHLTTYQEIGTSKRWLSVELLNTQQLCGGIIISKLYGNLRKMKCQIGNLRIETAMPCLPLRPVIQGELWLVIYPSQSRGAAASVMFTRTHRRLPVVKGVLEIPCKVSVSMRKTCPNLLLLEICKQLIEELYIKPKEKTVLGFFPTPVQ